MPEFASGEAKTAVVSVAAQPPGLDCEVELFLGPNDTTKVASSGRIAFVSSGESQAVLVPVFMPTATGSYHVYADLYAGSHLIAACQAIEDVVVARMPIDIIWG